MNLEDLSNDLSAFADDESEFIVERNGSFILKRSGTDFSGQYFEDENGQPYVRLGEEVIPYKKFISHHLARLDLFAQRLISKRAPVPAFVNSKAELDEPSQLVAEQLSAVEALDKECTTYLPFSSRVIFITADAGHGKTALLKHYQYTNAQRFLNNKSKFLFWHVDLQGRQLLRLSEALMGDLGELRMYGLWMQSIIRLLVHRLLVLAIDGFDELAAEQGGADALGALALLVKQVQNRGIIIAASRRTFFNTDDYLKRTRLIDRTMSHVCEFTQIRLLNWDKNQAIDYIKKVDIDGKRIDKHEEIYQQFLSEFQNPTHPMLVRPFLLTHMVKALIRYDLTPAEFVRGFNAPMKGVEDVVKAFITREVSDKWKYKDSGEPYLTVSQHMKLLASVGEEMWISQQDRLSVDVVETIATISLEEWGIEPGRKHQILEMVKMHALLIRPSDAIIDCRSFEHPEFRDYFIAQALVEKINLAQNSLSGEALGRFLAIAQMPDAVARHAAALLNRTEASVTTILNILSAIVAKEWKPTFVQTNIGTLVPFLLNGLTHQTAISFDAKVIYSSLVFENTEISKTRISSGTFLNTTFAHVKWEDVEFVNCEFNDVLFDKKNTIYNKVKMIDCRINSIRIKDDEEELQEYSPAQIATILGSIGVEVVSSAGNNSTNSDSNISIVHSNELRNLVRRVLRVFQRTTTITETKIRVRHRHDADIVLEEVMPLLEKHGIVRSQEWRGSGTKKESWLLCRSLEDVLRAEAGEGDQDLVNFWETVNENEQ
jgi:hypothetical protein